MNQASSHLLSRGKLHRATKKARFLKGERVEKVINYKHRMHCFRQACPPLGNGRDFSVNFLGLTRKCHADWLKVTYLGGWNCGQVRYYVLVY